MVWIDGLGRAGGKKDRAMPLKPDAVMARDGESVRETCRLGASLGASARLSAPERQMSSLLMR